MVILVTGDHGKKIKVAQNKFLKVIQHKIFSMKMSGKGSGRGGYQGRGGQRVPGGQGRGRYDRG